MQNNEVEMQIREIIATRLGIPCQKLDYINSDDNILGFKVGLTHREVIYFIYDIEKKYEIQIPQQDLVEEQTYTIRSLSNIVLKQQKLNVNGNKNGRK